MKIHSDSPGEEVQIQLISLIDVIFCILTFFILAALQLTRQQAINVDLPRASTGAPQAATQPRDKLIVSIDSIGQTYIDQQPVSQTTLYQQVIGYKQTNPDGLIVLYAPRTALYEDVVRVLDLLRSVGGDRVALATVPGSPTNSLAPASPGTIPPLLNPGLNPGQPANPLRVPGGTVPNPAPNPFQLPPGSGQAPTNPGVAPGGTSQFAPGGVSPSAPGGTAPSSRVPGASGSEP